jgi:dTDP-4-amino-4,6-dideoxygalactose transaminase
MIRLSKSIVGEEEIAAAVAVIQRGYLGMGSEVLSFEAELSDYFGGREVVCVSNGTSALQLSLQALGIKSGDEVLVPTLTYVASFQAIAATGATPIACDVRESDGLLNIEDARRRITSRTRAIMPVHYASNPGNLDDIYSFAHQNGLRVVEDAAHAFGCNHNRRRIGSFGDVVCFSFDGIKNITSGEGGAIVSSDHNLIANVKDSRLLGVEQDSERRYRGERSWELNVTTQGWRYHMSDLMAAIGRIQLRRFEVEFKPRRCSLAYHYRKAFEGISGISLFESDIEEIVPHIFPVRILHFHRDRVRKELEDNDIQTGVHYKPAHLLDYFGGGTTSLPVAERLYSELLTLPLHPGITDGECEHIIQTTLNALVR